MCFLLAADIIHHSSLSTKRVVPAFETVYAIPAGLEVIAIVALVKKLHLSAEHDPSPTFGFEGLVVHDEFPEYRRDRERFGDTLLPWDSVFQFKMTPGQRALFNEAEPKISRFRRTFASLYTPTLVEHSPTAWRSPGYLSADSDFDSDRAENGRDCSPSPPSQGSDDEEDELECKPHSQSENAVSPLANGSPLGST